jgi:hypothetical protein
MTKVGGTAKSSRYAKLKEYYESSEAMWSLDSATSTAKHCRRAQARFNRAIKALEPKRKRA